MKEPPAWVKEPPTVEEIAALVGLPPWLVKLVEAGGDVRIKWALRRRQW